MADAQVFQKTQPSILPLQSHSRPLTLSVQRHVAQQSVRMAKGDNQPPSFFPAPSTWTACSYLSTASQAPTSASRSQLPCRDMPEHTALPGSQGLWKKGTLGLTLLPFFCEITGQYACASSKGHEQPRTETLLRTSVPSCCLALGPAA